MEKYIIAVDMDGTLLNSENKISERNRNVLQRLMTDIMWYRQPEGPES